MTCTAARRHWMLYLDSEGDPALHLGVAEHLAACPACAAWFAGQERLERAVAHSLTRGAEAPGLWERVLVRTGLQRPPRRGGRRLLLMGGAAAVLLLATWLGLALWWPAGQPELARDAAGLHERWLRGEVRPDFASTSDHDVDRYLKSAAPFRVRCPPRSDVQFAVEGAGVLRLNGATAAYIVGRVRQVAVSVLVLDRSSLAAFPRDRDHLAGGGRRLCREGDVEMVEGVVAENVVIVVGRAPPETLEKLLDAYGSYPDG
jgi:anti-sigma factor RsiW